MDHWPNDAIITFVISLIISVLAVASCGAMFDAGQKAHNDLRESEKALARAESRIAIYEHFPLRDRMNWAAMPCPMKCECK